MISTARYIAHNWFTSLKHLFFYWVKKNKNVYSLITAIYVSTQILNIKHYTTYNIIISDIFIQYVFVKCLNVGVKFKYDMTTLDVHNSQN